MQSTIIQIFQKTLFKVAEAILKCANFQRKCTVCKHCDKIYTFLQTVLPKINTQPNALREFKTYYILNKGGILYIQIQFCDKKEKLLNSVVRIKLYLTWIY